MFKSLPGLPGVKGLTAAYIWRNPSLSNLHSHRKCDSRTFSSGLDTNADDQYSQLKRFYQLWWIHYLILACSKVYKLLWNILPNLWLPIKLPCTFIILFNPLAVKTQYYNWKARVSQIASTTPIWIYSTLRPTITIKIGEILKNQIKLSQFGTLKKKNHQVNKFALFYDLFVDWTRLPHKQTADWEAMYIVGIGGLQC